MNKILLNNTLHNVNGGGKNVIFTSLLSDYLYIIPCGDNC